MTLVSNELASIMASTNGVNLYPPQQGLLQNSFASSKKTPNMAPPPPPPKKKRSLPGNPDPGAEVVALSPRSLMATNRFVCEICNKGFQRDQNLQLHRRGHNLPWKLKQRSSKEVVRKKVYVCPEATCVHHDPSRALGDLTGIKKHFSRKHGEKKWKCDKCSKRYAVQSDWKAHSKICGTREYRCDCGTLFSRRDSFITHRAFCDALAAEESSISMTHTTNPNPLPTASSSSLSNYFTLHNSVNPNPNPNLSTSSLMSATALLQKASQMGVTMSSKMPTDGSILVRPHVHVGASNPAVFFPSREDMGGGGAPPFSTAAGQLSFNGTFTGMMASGEGQTRDFLGLRPFPHHGNFLDLDGLDQIGSSSYGHHNANSQPPW